jgi:LAO/AO transport system kinase
MKRSKNILNPADNETTHTAVAASQQTGEALYVVPGVSSAGATIPSTSKSRKKQPEPGIEELVKGILEGDRILLARTITLIESRKTDHNEKALRVLEHLLPYTGRSIRIGITGVPGVGKSTLIEALGTYLIRRGHRVAVLAIDPSSQLSRGSILGDKTRMEQLSVERNAFIRPSPAAGSLGGVARKTREAMLACEAAGFDVVLVETVGVGQSETVVHSMVDFFLLLMLAGAGDQLQGIKRGIMELADAIAIHKADGDNLLHAAVAKNEYEAALHLMSSTSPGWSPPVLTCSSLTLEGIPQLWETIADYQSRMTDSGFFVSKRKEQAVAWMNETIRQSLLDRFSTHPSVSKNLHIIEREVDAGNIPALTAAQRLLNMFFNE